MRYQNLKAFCKHLESAAPHNLCKCYLIAIADDYERKSASDAILRALAAPNGAFSAHSVAAFVEEMRSPSLFGGEPVVSIDEVDKLSKQDQIALAEAIVQSQPSGYAIVGARGKTSLLNVIEKQGVVLDLLEEKPWEREKRLAEQIDERVRRSGKKLSSDVAPLLLEKIGVNAALLDQEIDKLLCFVGERGNIERSDVFRVCGSSRNDTVWQMADEIVWEKGEVVGAGEMFHALVPLLRYQLQIGLKLATFIERRLPSDQWSAHFPKLRQKTLDLRAAQASKRGSAWFQRGLDHLFELELLSRDGSSQTEALLDLFRMRLQS